MWFHGGQNTIELLSPYFAGSGTIGEYSDDTAFHLRIGLDFQANTWSLDIDGERRFASGVDCNNLESIRFSMAPWIGGAGDALGNIRGDRQRCGYRRSRAIAVASDSRPPLGSPHHPTMWKSHLAGIAAPGNLTLRVMSCQTISTDSIFRITITTRRELRLGGRIHSLSRHCLSAGTSGRYRYYVIADR